MKIVSVPVPKNVEFGRLEPGDAFKFGEHLLLKIARMGGIYNAANLITGECVCFKDTDLVNMVDASLHWKFI